MAERQVVIDGGDQLLVAAVKRGPKGTPVLHLRLFDGMGQHTFVLEDVDAKELLPLLREIIPSSNQPALTAVEDVDDGDDAEGNSDG